MGQLSSISHPELHKVERIGWLRAAVLGANDGIVSTASLIVGIAAAGQSHAAILLSGAAALVGGAMSMAAGEYISVSSQADAEKAARHIEKIELAEQPELEREELIHIYQQRGLERPLATEVADALMAKDALQAHLRDELGITEIAKARPVQAAVSSASSFAVGAAVPLAVAALIPLQHVSVIVMLVSLLCLALLGAISAKTGGAPVWRGVVRVTFWSAAAMVATALVGKLFDAVVI